MPDFWELEDGTGVWQLEDGTGGWLLELQTGEEPGESGGRSRQVGVSAVKKQLEEPLGQRIKRKKKLLTVGELKLESRTKNIGSLLINFKSKCEAIVKPLNLLSTALGDIQIKHRARSESKLNYYTKTKSYGITAIADVIGERVNLKDFKEVISSVEKLTKIVKISALLSTINSIKSETKDTLSFDFLESTEEWKDALTEADFRAFTGSSSFVGNVRFDRDTNGMRILLNDRPYNFCNVPERIFDSFEGANSKGAFFNRIIKGQFDC